MLMVNHVEIILPRFTFVKINYSENNYYHHHVKKLISKL